MRLPLVGFDLRANRAEGGDVGRFCADRCGPAFTFPNAFGKLQVEKVIINIFPSSADGTQLSQTPTAVYLGNGVSLSNPFKGGISKSGHYLANVVVPSKGTSRVMFQVK